MKNTLEDLKDEDLITKGMMTKNPIRMTPEELEAWKKERDIYVRQYLFSIGQPLVYRKDGKIIAEYADGRIEKR
ncbi:hypothetical protein [Arachidicoccus soli]|uniref:Uncharacterized protein n=1 Tax=Arachidicoccus soli TaxID=2341117 RepID=A0A386HTH8_9BACT|nr:hypothetical protein [Arachidicoccus soli]AYD48781.1 hypothetical protein D6B99_14905 [Arachidicoccus soli]